ncbi:MAG: hypothetical protein KDD99_32360, partial [Bacteroidetes bacterium]|nr:hypothetical protein [Bacteroidota bacterium]
GVTDGNIDINFIQGSVSTPLVNAIEILGATGVVSTKSLVASQNSVHFFSTEVDSTSSPEFDTLSNSGNSTVTVSAVNITGTDAAMFSHNLTVPFTIDGGNTLPFEITFTPGSIGSKSANLELVHDGDNGSPLVIALTGEAISSTNQPPVSNLGNQSDSINSVINISGSSYASDPEGDNLTFSATGLSSIGLNINSVNGDITGTLISTPGDYPVSIKIVDDGLPADSVEETIIWSVTDPAAATVLYRVNTGGVLVSALDSPNQDWDEDTQTNGSLYRNGGSKTNGYSITNLDVSVPNSTPVTIFQSERWDPKSGAQMEWDFPVNNIDSYEIRLYFADGYTGTNQPGKRIFSVEIEGDTLLKDFDIVAEAGFMVGMMKSFVVPVIDGNIDINFIQGPLSTPLVNGIEILG